MTDISFIQVVSPDDIEEARQLFLEYAAGVGISLCFQNFDEEVAGLPGKYAPPSGRLLLAYSDGHLAGCIALRALDTETCEMKRLFVGSEFRGIGLGRKLVETIISEARDIGYIRMVLDTLPGRMDTAIGLYKKMGFTEVPPYYDNPVEDAIFMELRL